MQDEYAERMKWLTRPMRYMTDREVESALAERREALTHATTKMGEELCQVAIAKLEAEINGRRERA